MHKFPTFRQLESIDCAPACLKIISEYYGKKIPFDYLKKVVKTSWKGSRFLNLIEASEILGFKVQDGEISLSELIDKNPFPFIAYVRKTHYIVVYKIDTNFVYVSDPAIGLNKIKINDFLKIWKEKSGNGLVLLLEPTEKFFNKEYKKNNFIWNHFLLLFNNFNKELIFLFSSILLFSFSSVFLFLQLKVFFKISYNNNHGLLFLGFILTVFLFFCTKYFISILSKKISSKLLSSFSNDIMSSPYYLFKTKTKSDILNSTNDLYSVIEATNKTFNVLLNFCINLFALIIAFLYKDYLMLLVIILINIFYFILIKKISNKIYKQSVFNISFHNNFYRKLSWLVNNIKFIKSYELQNKKKQEFNEYIDEKKSFNSNNALEFIYSHWTNFKIFFYVSLLFFFNEFYEVDGLKYELLIIEIFLIFYIMLCVNVNYILAIKQLRVGLQKMNSLKTFSNRDNETKDVFKKRIEITNLNFKRKNKVFFNNISFKIEKNKTTFLMGFRNKSALINSILGFYSVERNIISLDEFDINDFSEHNRLSQFSVYDYEGLIIKDSILNNICLKEFPLKKELVLFLEEEILNNHLNLNSRITNNLLNPKLKQFVLLARAIQRDSPIIILIEPLRGFNYYFNEKVLQIISSILGKKTVLIISNSNNACNFKADFVYKFNEKDNKLYKATLD